MRARRLLAMFLVALFSAGCSKGGLYNPAPTASRTPTIAQPRTPSPSPKAGLLAFSSGESIYLVSLADNSIRRVTDGYSPSLSPSGREIVYCKDRNIWVVDADGRNPRLLAEVFSPSPLESWSLGAASVAWSPDGRFILYNRSRTGGSGVSEVWVMDREGNQPKLLLQSGNFLLPTWVGTNQVAVYHKWDGIIELFGLEGQIEGEINTRLQRAALSAQKSPGEVELWLLGPIIPVLEGGDIVVGSEGTWDVIAQGLNPIWSPEGESIVFIHDGAIWIMQKDRSGKYQLVNLDLLEGMPKSRMPLVCSFLSWVAP